MTRTRLALLALALLAAPAVAEGDAPPPLEKRLAALAAPFVEGEVLVGGVIGVARGGRTWVVPFGTRTYGGTERPDGDTVYEIGSVTKVMTGILLAHAVVDGSVKLDDPIASLFPEGTRLPGTDDDPIRLVHLSTHTSSLPRMPGNFAPKDRTNPYADYDEERMLSFLDGWRLEGKRGTRYLYSNLAVGLLGVALSREAEKPYETLLRERILAPLGMESTGIALTDSMKGRLAPGYTSGFSPAANWDLAAFAGAGGVRSTTNDMLRFLRGHLKPRRDVLSAAMSLARKVHVRPENGPRMGLGWHFHGRGSRVGHNGQTGGYHSFVALDPEAGWGLVILSNTATGGVDALGRRIAELLDGGSPEPEKIPVPARVAPEILDAYVGRYQMSPMFVLTVTRDGSRLLVQATMQPAFRVYPVSETKFVWRVVKASVEFTRNEKGEVVGLVLDQNGRRHTAARLP
jgi:D-alanyl-D-alanine-carboxypeptidase/D-alanyl-D-alanine-endopeptidase